MTSHPRGQGPSRVHTSVWVFAGVVGSRLDEKYTCWCGAQTTVRAGQTPRDVQHS